MFISGLVIVLRLCEMLITVSVSLQLFQNKVGFFFFLLISGYAFVDSTMGQFAKVLFAFSLYDTLLF